MRAHVIENGVVVNIIEVESLDFLPNLVEATEGSIGWLYDGETFSPPPAPPDPVPASVTMRQARLALLGAGLLDDVDAALAAIPDAMQRRAAQIEWEFAATVDRQSPWVANLAGALGLADEQLDALFVAAAGL